MIAETRGGKHHTRSRLGLLLQAHARVDLAQLAKDKSKGTKIPKDLD
ncbi:MAG: hypothetical protein ACYTGW_02120 [Planctomycetota bacterium]